MPLTAVIVLNAALDLGVLVALAWFCRIPFRLSQPRTIAAVPSAAERARPARESEARAA